MRSRMNFDVVKNLVNSRVLSHLSMLDLGVMHLRHLVIPESWVQYELGENT